MITIRSPKTPEEFSLYYDLRWRILREPWNQPRGSEKDDKEEESYHLMAFQNNEPLKPLGVGRIHMNNQEEAQIRYMGVEKKYEKRGIGKLILKKLEEHAKEKWKAKRITLNARGNAVGFYEKFGYCIIKKAHVLFGNIPHYKMEKRI